MTTAAIVPAQHIVPAHTTRAARPLATIPRAALVPEQGAAVLLPDGTSAALFLLHDGSVHAVGNIDPFYRAPVICHGIVGDRRGAPTVASPLGKQVFCLRTGNCLDDASVRLPVFGVAMDGELIHLSSLVHKPETAALTS